MIYFIQNTGEGLLTFPDVSDTSPKDKIQHAVDDQEKNLRGYCRNYEKIKKLSFPEDMSYFEILER